MTSRCSAALCAAAESHVVSRGGRRIVLEVGEENLAARALYERLGYRRTDDLPRQVSGRVETRSGPIDIDETLVRYDKVL